MANPVAHFEIYGDNPQNSPASTKASSAGRSTKRGMDYWRIRTVQTDAKGAPHVNNEDMLDT